MILHKDLNVYPYKFVVMQEWSYRDMANRSTVADHLIRIFSDDVIIPTTNEAPYQVSGGPLSVNMWLFCVEWRTSEL
jgi:hypothetical protein